MLSSDTPNAVIGEVGAPPPVVPVDVTAARPRHRRQRCRWTPRWPTRPTSACRSAARWSTRSRRSRSAQAATQIYDGPPANESGTMCLHDLSAREPRRRWASVTATSARACPGDAGRRRPSSRPRPRATSTTAFSDCRARRLRRAACRRTWSREHRAAARAARRRRSSPRVRRLGSRRGSTVRVRLLVRAYRGARADDRHSACGSPPTPSGPLRRDDPRPAAARRRPRAACAASQRATRAPGPDRRPRRGPPATPRPGAARRRSPAIASYDGLAREHPGPRQAARVPRPVAADHRPHRAGLCR